MHFREHLTLLPNVYSKLFCELPHSTVHNPIIYLQMFKTISHPIKSKTNTYTHIELKPKLIWTIHANHY